MKPVGANLDARADLADLGGLLQHRDGKALTHQGEGSSQATNAATGNDDGKLKSLSAHVCSSKIKDKKLARLYACLLIVWKPVRLFAIQ
jgi:hypothetical protein